MNIMWILTSLAIGLAGCAASGSGGGYSGPISCKGDIACPTPLQCDPKWTECATPETIACRSEQDCAIEGLCTWNGSKCIAATDKDCRQSAAFAAASSSVHAVNGKCEVAMGKPDAANGQ